MCEKSGIYCVENIFNSKKYIGQSVDVYRRLREHKSHLKNNKHKNKHLQFSWNIYGENNFKFYVLEICDKSDLDRKEKYYIQIYNTRNDEFGYNIEPGGVINHSMSEYSKAKISSSLKGRIFTDEHKNKIGEANRVRVITDEMKANMSKNHADVSGKNNPRCIPLYCPQLDEEFWGAKEAKDKYGISRSGICSCASGKLQSAGKHPITGEPLTWVKLESKNC